MVYILTFNLFILSFRPYKTLPIPSLLRVDMGSNIRRTCGNSKVKSSRVWSLCTSVVYEHDGLGRLGFQDPKTLPSLRTIRSRSVVHSSIKLHLRLSSFVHIPESLTINYLKFLIHITAYLLQDHFEIAKFLLLFDS